MHTFACSSALDLSTPTSAVPGPSSTMQIVNVSGGFSLSQSHPGLCNTTSDDNKSGVFTPSQSHPPQSEHDKDNSINSLPTTKPQRLDTPHTRLDKVQYNMRMDRQIAVEQTQDLHQRNDEQMLLLKALEGNVEKIQQDVQNLPQHGSLCVLLDSCSNGR